MKITIPDRQHPSLNQWTRWHWTKKSRVKKSWEQEIALRCGKYGTPNLTGVMVEIRYYFKDKRVRDRDNYVPKFILDGLVKAGIIEDDNDNDIYQNWKLLYDKEKPRTEIEIKEVQ